MDLYRAFFDAGWKESDVDDLSIWGAAHLMGIRPDGGLTGDALLEHNMAVAEGRAEPVVVAVELTPEQKRMLAEAEASGGG